MCTDSILKKSYNGLPRAWVVRRNPIKDIFLIDLHCHILPGLDDGADDWEESVEMARLAVDDGITGIVCTPHLSPAFPGNNREAILAAFEKLKDRLREEEIQLDIYPGSELAIDFNLPEKIESGELLTINDTRKVALIEMPGDVIPPSMDRFFWMLQVKGVTPVLAHPERNFLLMRYPSMLAKWIDAGVLVQITGASLRGHYGGPIRDFCIKMLRQNLVHFVATDSHGPERRRPRLSKAREIVESIAGHEAAKNIFDQYPRKIVSGDIPYVTSPLLQEDQKKAIPLIRRIFPFWKN